MNKSILVKVLLAGLICIMSLTSIEASASQNQPIQVGGIVYVSNVGQTFIKGNDGVNYYVADVGNTNPGTNVEVTIAPINDDEDDEEEEEEDVKTDIVIYKVLSLRVSKTN